MLDLINSIHIFALANAKKELLAQLVEQRPFKAWALGSSPRGITKSLLFKGAFLVNTPKLFDPLVAVLHHFSALILESKKNGQPIIYTDISNYISLKNGLIVSWLVDGSSAKVVVLLKS